MIRVTHVSLPPGLSALTHRGPGDDLNVYVSDALDPGRQRAAVRVALRASRRAGWRAALVPAPSVALLLAASLSWFRRAARVLRAHWVAWATATAAAAIASTAVYVATAPHPHGPAAPVAGRSAAPETSLPVTRPHTSRHVSRPPAAGAPSAAPQATPRPVATVSALPTSSSTPPRPAPSPSRSRPPRPSPSPSPGQSRHCVRILGIWVCLGVGA